LTKEIKATLNDLLEKKDIPCKSLAAALKKLMIRNLVNAEINTSEDIYNFVAYRDLGMTEDEID